MIICTAFCRDASDTGTIWIEVIEAEDLESAELVARIQCAAAWERWKEDDAGELILDDNGKPIPNVDSIHCLGLAEGDVNILMWEDLGV